MHRPDENSLVDVLRSYIESVLANVHDMKVLLFDKETAQIASLVYAQSELLQQDVVLIETLEARTRKPVDEAVSALQCVSILRPTQENLRDICGELNCPHFNTYLIFFTNVVPKEWLQQIALADHSSKVFVVHEIFMDVLAINKRLFSCGISSTIRFWDDTKKQRIVEGIFSLVCALKLRAGIHYDANSPLCLDIGSRVATQVSSNMDLFQSALTPAIVILIDRRSDPLTPLVHGWSYQTLVHEILGIRNNVVALKSDPSKSVVLDERTDEFFANHLFTNFGNVGEAANKLTENVKSQHVDVREITDIEGLKKFIHSYPVFQKKQAVAAKHMALLGDVTNAFRAENLMLLGALEQVIATETDQAGHHREVLDVIRSPQSTDQNALRVALLYAIHYENDAASIEQIREALESRTNGRHLVAAVDSYIAFAGADAFRRPEPLFAGKSLLRKAQKAIGLEGNKLNLFQPALAGILRRIPSGTRRDPQFTKLFPIIRGTPEVGDPRKVIVFYVGGVTYEEARVAWEAARGGETPPIDVIIGGTTVHNMDTFVRFELLGERERRDA
jgi:vacuolar protein sorting-associated protein 45